MESLKIFDDFKLSALDENWIKSVWDGEFLSYNKPPDEYLMFMESEDMRSLLHESCIVVKTWFTESTHQNESEHRGSDTSWNTLIILDMKVQALLPVLGYIMKNGQSTEADEDLRLSCLNATSLYFILLAVPGSNAFNIFHPNLYQRAIETFRMSTRLLPLVKKRNRTINLDSLNISEESANECGLTLIEKDTLVRNLNNVLCNLLIMAQSFWFKSNMQSLDITIQGLLELTKLESDGTESHLQTGQRDTLQLSLPQNAYAALEEFCDNKHGPVDMTIMFIVKYIIPRLLCKPSDVQIKLISNIREATINFLKRILDTHEQKARHSIVILIQHLMVKCPDRHEARQKQAAVLIKVLNICKESILLEAFQNLILLSHHAKIPCRIFAQEIIGKVLIDPFLTYCELSEDSRTRLKSIFFAVILNRCMDSSSMVRGKAMATIAEFTESKVNTNEVILKDIFEGSDPNKEFATFQDLKKSMSKNVALLPGSNILINMLMDRIEDERALVRRSALQIFKNLTIMFPTLVHEVVPVISCRCRDPTLVVRRFSVQVLSQLLYQFPDDSQLLQEWVQTVIPQIFDIEVKVQEKVLEYLEELLLNRIRDISTYTDDTADELPWKILITITRMKMRKHLSKVCSLWVKNGVVTKSVVNNIQSHIGTSNNTAAWVFLAALAENTKLPNMDKYISNYKELLDGNDFHTSLVLQVLRYSWSCLKREVLNCLHVYLYECLQQFKINFGLISICLDIIHTVVQYLHPNSGNNLMESYMLNLIKLSELEIKKIITSESEAAEAVPNYLKAMFTLGHATLLCRSKISPLTLRILEGLLLEWESLPEVIKEIEELQSSAVVILGQQAIRDREIAQEVVPIFSRIMRQETNLNSVVQIAVKINSAKALADICIRFTALVEPHLSDMCVSMKDASPHVREAIMVIFIQLLLEDFIKIKGPFFFHILTMLSDSDDMIRELTVFLIEERLLAKNKTLISQQFLESIYHYNNYQSKHKFYDRKMHEKEAKVLTLPGRRNENKRRVIYDFMLEHLDPPGKIKVLVKVTSQILGGVCVGTVNVRKEEGACVLRDALYVINNERLQPSSFNKHGDDDQQEQEESTVQTVTPNANAINIIVEGIKKHSLDVLLPILIKLREKLTILKSSLQNDVKKILVKLYSEYNKEHLLNILNEYPSLEKDVEQYKRELESISLDDENCSEEDSTPSNTNNQLRINGDVIPEANNLAPKVMLQRLSASRLSNWKSTTKTTSLPLSSPSSLDSWHSLALPNQFLPTSSPLEPGPSTSTPKSSRCSDSGLDNVTGHVSKARRLSAFFRDVDASSCVKYDTVGRRLRPIQDESESD